jgi:hypothetical protein
MLPALIGPEKVVVPILLSSVSLSQLHCVVVRDNLLYDIKNKKERAIFTAPSIKHNL